MFHLVANALCNYETGKHYFNLHDKHIALLHQFNSNLN